MIKYLTTTTLILAWVFVFSVCWSYFILQFIEKPVVQRFFYSPKPMLPCLVLGPMAVVSFHYLGDINLLYPVASLATWQETIWIAIMPALILFVASGWANRIGYVMIAEFKFWQKKPFVWLESIGGRPPKKTLAKLLFSRTFCESCAASLPWVFGEIVIIECIFNAPGLGLESWRAAKSANLNAIILSLSWLLFLYGMITACNTILNKRIGQKLSGYC